MMALTFGEWRRASSGTRADYENYLAELARRASGQVTVTLTAAEQAVLLRAADEIAADRGTGTPWESVAAKIRQALDDR